MAKNQWIPAHQAEDRDVYCGNCDAPVKGHWHKCPQCNAKFTANMHGYARLCKNSSCRRTEMGGHPHGLCTFHWKDKKRRQANTANQPNCSCGNKAPHDNVYCRRCQEIRSQHAMQKLSISQYLYS